VIHVDTSFLIDLLREQSRRAEGPATSWLSAHADAALGVSVFVACELFAGAAGAEHPAREHQRVRELLSAVATIYPDDRFAERYGEVVDRLQSRGRTVAQMDLLIALTAIVDGASLVTANRRHFEVVPDLTVMAYR
jgi:tRNA(fMet)-specific endonuclease VapC